MIVKNKAKPYRPEALVYLLQEVERELRAYGRTDAARLVNLSANAVSQDIGSSGQRH